MTKIRTDQIKDVTVTAAEINFLSGADSNIQDQIDAIGGGKPFATLVVAASDALSTAGADYICDGSADQTEIEAAIAALPAGGGRIILTEGTFSLTADITISGLDNIIIQGQGKATIIFDHATFASNTASINIINSDYITIRDLSVDGNMANMSGVFPHGIGIDNASSYIKIEGCYVQNTVSANIFDNGSPFTSILNNFLSTTSVGGGYSNIEGGGSNALIENNVCIAGDWANIAIYTGKTGLKITNNHCSDCGSGGAAALEISSEAIIEGNLISNPAKRAIQLDQAVSIVASNIIHITNDPTNEIIYVNFAPNSVIQNNSITVATGNTVALTAIRSDSISVTITNNNIDFSTNEAHTGILMTTDQAIITGNYIGFASATSGSFGMDLSASSYSIVNGNYIDLADTAITTAGSIENSFNGNQIYDCNYGIDISAASTISIGNNVFEACANAVYSLSNSYSQKIIVSNNTFMSVVEHTVLFRSTRYSVVSNNTFTRCGLGTNNTYSCVFLTTVSGTNYSNYNTINGNVFTSTAANLPAYNIRENSSNDGSNIITSNVALNAATAQISTQAGGTLVANNLTS